MFRDNSKRSKRKPFKDRWRDSGYDYRYIRDGLVKETPQGVVTIDTRLISGVPHADLAWNVVTGEAKEYVGEMSSLLPDEYWAAMDYLLKDYDRFLRRHKDYKPKERIVPPVLETISKKKEQQAAMPADTPPPPLPDDEVEWVLHAVRRQAEGTSPDPGTSKVDEQGKTKIRRGSSEKVFGAILKHEGAAVTTDELVSETGLTRQQVHNGCHYLVGKGIVMRLMNGIYQIHPDAVKLSERVNVDVRHHDVIVASGKSLSGPGAAPVAQDGRNGSDPASVPPAAVRPAERPTAPNGDHESVIELVLDLLRPDGFKAKHLAAIQAWVEATRELLRVTDG